VTAEQSLLQAFGFEEAFAPAEQNGHTYHLVCANCQNVFGSNRKQLPGQRTYCSKAECKKAGAAQRVRDYRQRKVES
jgi:Fe2+ or Zn2+ uptake regulation protein